MFYREVVVTDKRNEARADEAHARGDVVALCNLAGRGDQWAREILYDDYGVNDEDRRAILAHEGRV